MFDTLRAPNICYCLGPPGDSQRDVTYLFTEGFRRIWIPQQDGLCQRKVKGTDLLLKCYEFTSFALLVQSPPPESLSASKVSANTQLCFGNTAQYTGKAYSFQILSLKRFYSFSSSSHNNKPNQTKPNKIKFKKSMRQALASLSCPCTWYYTILLYKTSHCPKTAGTAKLSRITAAALSPDASTIQIQTPLLWRLRWFIEPEFVRHMAWRSEWYNLCSNTSLGAPQIPGTSWQLPTCWQGRRELKARSGVGQARGVFQRSLSCSPPQNPRDLTAAPLAQARLQQWGSRREAHVERVHLPGVWASEHLPTSTFATGRAYPHFFSSHKQ